ncbi:site-2 protease family protein [Planococcus donghaensis]|uniref:site-2 protease family protein n=1 Tax=Planococcus donghaensis TaxID=414778 RepID=UPI001ED8D55E|nr:site-2 protease family protein [Planococcus donghaensis]
MENILGMLFEVVMVLLIISAALLIHELGHAVGLVVKNKKVKPEVYLGSLSKEKKLKLSLGRITCYITIALSGICRISNESEISPLTNKQRIIFAAGGPIASLLGFAIFYLSSHFVPGVMGIVSNRVAFVSLITFFLTVIPYNYPAFFKHVSGFQSDGLYILNIIREMKNHSKAVS